MVDNRITRSTNNVNYAVALNSTSFDFTPYPNGIVINDISGISQQITANIENLSLQCIYLNTQGQSNITSTVKSTYFGSNGNANLYNIGGAGGSNGASITPIIDITAGTISITPSSFASPGAVPAIQAPTYDSDIGISGSAGFEGNIDEDGPVGNYIQPTAAIIAYYSEDASLAPQYGYNVQFRASNILQWGC